MAWYELLRKTLGYRFPRLGNHANQLFFKSIPNEATVDLFPRVRLPLDFRDETQRSTYWRGSRFEYPTGQIMETWCETADIFFDIGANYGFFSYWMSSRYPELTVHSFEPNPKNYLKIQQTKEANNLKYLYAWNMGLGSTSEILPLRTGVADSGHSTFGRHPHLDHSSIVSEIEVRPFDEWLEENGIPLPDRPSWVAKIDVEGYELKVLEGMRGALQRKVFSGIAIELLDYTLAFCDAKSSDVFTLFAEYGYRPLSNSSGFKVKGMTNTFFVPDSR